MVEALEKKLRDYGKVVVSYNGQNFDYPLIQKTMYKSLKPPYILNTEEISKAISSM